MKSIANKYPTHEYKGFKMRFGKPLPFGASVVPGGINFSVFSRNASSCELVLFYKGHKQPFGIIPFPKEFRIGNVYTMIVFDIDYDKIEYGFKMDGSFNIREGHRFDKNKILLDPYAKAIGGRDSWALEPDFKDVFQHRGRVVIDDFDWENDRPLELPFEDLIIYETHVRGFTAYENSKVKAKGTFEGLREKIPYLKSLGINCIELMPIYEFDEFENSKISVITGKRLMNYWGYSSLAFFAPKAGFAYKGIEGNEIDELKNLIKDLHKNGLEVILDVVFNHTAEGNEKGNYISFRGLDNKTYYMLTPEGTYYNFSGCGNTLNCNNPIVRNLILDCLRYWASEYHVDGFRFDLASILGRNQNGAPMPNPPLLESLAYDPVLGKCKLIAEAWDAGGLYQVGAFPEGWSEWNGKYRDEIRKFIKGDGGMVWNIAQRIQGSPDLYAKDERGTNASINFITCHDGFTLMDLFSYNEKHNEMNEEDNRDGSDNNYSWNCGWEGPNFEPEIVKLRTKMIKNAITILMISHGVPMLLAGDEFGNSQFGNNNAYCQDNEISWLNWDLINENAEIFNFFQKIIKFRNVHPVLRTSEHFQSQDYLNLGFKDISFHGQKSNLPDYSYESRVLGVLFNGSYAKQGKVKDDDIYIAMNMHWEMKVFELPNIKSGKRWYVFANTWMEKGLDIYEVGNEIMLENQKEIIVGARSIIVLIAR